MLQSQNRTARVLLAGDTEVREEHMASSTYTRP
jgi:hypothetical protein